MADYDVSAVGLANPPQSAPLTTYRPALLVKNNGIHVAAVTGTIAIYNAGRQVYASTVALSTLAAGATGQAQAADDWLPEVQGAHVVTGYVTTDRDQVQANNPLSPVTIIVGPPPPPPTPATLDDVVAALLPVSKDSTLVDVRDKLPADPALDPTVAEVRDKLIDAPATEPTLAQMALEDTQDEVLNKLGAGLPPELGEDNALKVDASMAPVTISPAPGQVQSLGKLEVGTTPQEILFDQHTLSIIVQAWPTNTGNILVGIVDVNPAGHHAIAVLLPGDSLTIEYDNNEGALSIVATVPAQSAIVAAILRQ